MLKKLDDRVLLPLEESVDFCNKELLFPATLEEIETLIEAYLLPVFSDGSRRHVLTQDLRSLLPIISHMAATRGTPFLGRTLFSSGIPAEIHPRADVKVEIGAVDGDIAPAFYAGVRNLAQQTMSDMHETSKDSSSVPYYPPSRVLTSSPVVRHYVEGQLARCLTTDLSRASEFARSADYMGSKRNLASFLVEAISSALPPTGTIVDLMCGSGAASGAFCRFWKTYASDAQRFCEILAEVQGSEFSVSNAERLLKNVVPKAQEHARHLSKTLDFFLKWEDRVLHGDIGPELLEDYRGFVGALPTYPSKWGAHGWFPFQEVEARKKDHTLHPYCLFVTYFANVYFGLRQCVEIDSLRFAIDQMQSEHDQRWALGALIATLSKLGTTYGGHFAQPRLKAPSDLTTNNIARVLEQRAYSIIHEFSVRLLNLSQESEKAPNCVRVIGGPWQKALSAARDSFGSDQVLVYVDAPYKREEYSRYYHVLETLVLYSYPSCAKASKLPDKKKGERFQSEFFTRNKMQLASVFAGLICSVLKNGWTCAWSYSDSGSASVVKVVEQVCQDVGAQVRSYAVPYTHRSQGKSQGRRRLSKKVVEYLIIFVPRERQENGLSFKSTHALVNDANDLIT
jgi:adenine-specific DNA methylase